MRENNMQARTAHLATRVGSHKHWHHQVIIGISGEADFEIEGLGGKVDEYSGCIVPSNEQHSFCGVNDNNVFILDIDPQFIPYPEQADTIEDVRRLFDGRRYFSIDQQMHLMLFSLANELRLFKDDSSVKPMVAGLVLQSLLHRLITSVSSAQRLYGERLDMNLIRQYVHAHIDEKIQVSDLASICGLSPSHFYQKFREKTGASPHQYLIHERVKVAKFLLTKTHKTLTDICFSLGFSSQSAFTNTFTKKAGLSPSQYRQKHQ
jgi:AraC-like DNA-binding protein